MWRSPRYRTRDHVIPFGLFWIYYRAMAANHALERINQTKAVATAIGMCFANKDADLTEATQAELREAFLSR